MINTLALYGHSLSELDLVNVHNQIEHGPGRLRESLFQRGSPAEDTHVRLVVEIGKRTAAGLQEFLRETETALSSTQLALCHQLLQPGQLIHDEHAVEMVDFVLQNSGLKSIGLDDDLLAIQVQAVDEHFFTSLHVD